MLEPFLELVLNGADIALTVLVLLALWDGRLGGSGLLGRRLERRRVASAREIERFLGQVRPAARRMSVERAAAGAHDAGLARRLPALRTACPSSRGAGSPRETERALTG